MHSSLAVLAFAAFAAAEPNPGGVVANVSPDGSAPAGCSRNCAGSFQISQVSLSTGTKRSIDERDTNSTLSCELSHGVLKDSEGRTGYVASNDQFQFDDPPQAGAKYTAGFTICADGSIALGSETIWWSCLSGSFSNLYTSSQGAQCKQVHLQAVGSDLSCGSGKTGSSPAQYASSTPATPTGTETAGACTQTDDAQPQCPLTTATPTATPTPAAAVCTVFSDGQPQCPGFAGTGTGTAAVPSSTFTGAPITPANAAVNAFGLQREMFGLAAAGIAAVVML